MRKFSGLTPISERNMKMNTDADAAETQYDLLECHRPEEKARVQALNDFVIFGTMMAGSFLSGGLLSSFGWSAVLVLSFAPLLAALLALIGSSHRSGLRQGFEGDAR